MRASLILLFVGCVLLAVELETKLSWSLIPAVAWFIGCAIIIGNGDKL